MQITYVVNVPVTDVWENPWVGSKEERLTQALLGDYVSAQEEDDEWVLGQVPDGYKGYLRRSDLVPEPASLTAIRCTVVKAETGIRSVKRPPSLLMKVYLGTCLQLGAGEELGYTKSEYTVCLPDGTQGLIAPYAVVLEGAPARTPDIAETALALALALRGASYLWGGITCAGVDCSGLVYVAYRAAGLLLPRDADRQFAYSEPVVGQPSPGDLVFFATEEPGLASHVGLYAGQGQFLHASSRLGGVVVTSLNSPFYRECFLGWRRCRK